jgi:hypothetical protein
MVATDVLQCPGGVHLSNQADDFLPLLIAKLNNKLSIRVFQQTCFNTDVPGFLDQQAIG